MGLGEWEKTKKWINMKNNKFRQSIRKHDRIRKLKDDLPNIKKRIKKLSKEWDKKMNDNSTNDLSFNDFKKIVEPIESELDDLRRKLRYVQDYKLERLIDETDYDDEILSIEDFKECVKSGMFTDYDGHGYYVKDNQISDVVIIPSDFDHGMVRHDFDKIIWFNK